LVHNLFIPTQLLVEIQQLDTRLCILIPLVLVIQQMVRMLLGQTQQEKPIQLLELVLCILTPLLVTIHLSVTLLFIQTPLGLTTQLLDIILSISTLLVLATQLTDTKLLNQTQLLLKTQQWDTNLLFQTPLDQVILPLEFLRSISIQLELITLRLEKLLFTLIPLAITSQQWEDVLLNQTLQVMIILL